MQTQAATEASKREAVRTDMVRTKIKGGAKAPTQIYVGSIRHDATKLCRIVGG